LAVTALLAAAHRTFNDPDIVITPNVDHADVYFQAVKPTLIDFARKFIKNPLNALTDDTILNLRGDVLITNNSGRSFGERNLTRDGILHNAVPEWYLINVLQTNGVLDTTLWDPSSINNLATSDGILPEWYIDFVLRRRGAS
jgi:hypothetical protein